MPLSLFSLRQQQQHAINTQINYPICVLYFNPAAEANIYNLIPYLAPTNRGIFHLLLQNDSQNATLIEADPNSTDYPNPRRIF